MVTSFLFFFLVVANNNRATNLFLLQNHSFSYKYTHWLCLCVILQLHWMSKWITHNTFVAAALAPAAPMNEMYNKKTHRQSSKLAESSMSKSNTKKKKINGKWRQPNELWPLNQIANWLRYVRHSNGYVVIYTGRLLLFFFGLFALSRFQKFSFIHLQ